MLHRLAVEPSIRSELAEWLPASAMQLAPPPDGLQTTHCSGSDGQLPGS
jgi:hypothetical protein